MESPLEVLTQIARALEEQGVAYVVVGSFASSMRGVYRATADIDIVADLKHRAGGEASQVQWSDVLGVVGAQGSELDVEHLREWAGRIGVRDLLDRVLPSQE